MPAASWPHSQPLDGLLRHKTGWVTWFPPPLHGRWTSLPFQWPAILATRLHTAALILWIPLHHQLTLTLLSRFFSLPQGLIPYGFHSPNIFVRLFEQWLIEPPASNKIPVSQVACKTTEQPRWLVWLGTWHGYRGGAEHAATFHPGHIISLRRRSCSRCFFGSLLSSSKTEIQKQLLMAKGKVKFKN